MTATTAQQRTTALPIPAATDLPAELVQSPTWAAWKFIERDGQPVKFPIDANPGPRQGKGAKANDEATWATFAVASAYAKRHGCGLWFFIKAPFVGFDADDCRDCDTGELTPIATSVFGGVDSYTEVSISGTGVKAIGYGRKPGTRCRRNGLQLEIYDRLRGFALTGARLPDAPLAINDCQGALDHIYSAAFGPVEEEAPPQRGPQPITDDDDQTVIEWLHSYRHGARFAALWRGDTSAYSGDESAADLALVSALAWRVGPDPSRIYRLVEASGLHRAKWERQDYRDRTIRKAIEGCRSFYTQPIPNRPAAPDPQPLADEDATTPGEGESPRVVELVAQVTRLQGEVEGERRLRLETQRMLANVLAIRRNPHIKAERDTIAAAVIDVKAEIANGRADAEGYVRQNTQRLADNVGKSPQATQSHMARSVEWEFFDRKLVEEYDRDTNQRRTVYYIRPKAEPEDLLATLVTFIPPQEEGKEKWGGTRIPCPGCGSTKRRKVVSCADCGHEFSHTVTDIADAIDGLRAEQQPDEPRADAESVPPTPITSSQAHTYPQAATGPVHVVESAEGDGDEADSWDPYECNHRDCKRRTLPDKRYCDWHDPDRLARFSQRSQPAPANDPTLVITDDEADPLGFAAPAPVLPPYQPPAPPPFIVHPGEPQGFSPVERATSGAGCQRCGAALYGKVPHCAPCGRIVAGLPLYSHQRDPLANQSGDQAAGGDD